MRKTRKIRIRPVLFRRLKAAHPDIYSAAKAYAEKQGLNISDVIGAAVAAYLGSSEEGKEELEEAIMAKHQSGGGIGGIDGAINLFTKVCDAMGSMFESMNKARAGMSVSSMVTDFETLTTSLERMKKAGAEAGKGSIEDTVADAFVRGIIERLTGGVKKSPPIKKGKGKVTELK